MDFSWSEEHATFRQEVQEFIRTHWKGGRGRGEEDAPADAVATYRKALAENGWLTVAWPKQYGGREASHFQQMIFMEEASINGTPNGGQGADRVGPVLMIHGTDEQKAEHLPKIARGEVNWCQGFSEPGAGSDLAGLQTRAVRDGDDFVINGQKIWTSGAKNADWIHVLTRTDPDAAKHRGVTYFMLDMKTPGINVRPIQQIHGGAEFNETFFEDVRVPAKNMIGEENRGWYIAATALDFERSGIFRMAGMIGPFNRLKDFATQPDSAGKGRKIVDTPLNRVKIADTATELIVARYLGYRVTWMQSKGLVPNYESSISKAFGTELQQRNARRGINMLGLFGNLAKGEARAPMGGEYSHLYLSTVSATIAGGTSEINRNIIATRGLGLPRG